MINNISVLVDNDSWILPYASKLLDELKKLGKKATLVRNHNEVEVGDVCFLIGCTKIVSEEILRRNKHNLVVHESALPQGKGFAPVAWQILEGKNEIPVSLIDANKEADSGDIWLTDTIKLSGHELSAEWRELQGNITIELALKFVKEYEYLKPKKQVGDSCFYKRRRPCDSQIDIDKNFRDIIPLLRVVDNRSYPAFFEYLGCKYKIEITKYE